MDQLHTMNWALRFLAGDGLEMGELPMSGDITVEAWVRPDPATRAVTLFADGYFTGAEARLRPGRCEDLAPYPLGRDAAQSAQVPAGMEIVLFDEPGCRGPAIRIARDAAGFPDYDDKAASALVVETDRTGGAWAVVFGGAGWTGRAAALPIGRVWDVDELGLDILDIKSLVVPPGLRVILFAEEDGRGARTSFDADTEDVSSAGFTVASVEVRRAPRSVTQPTPAAPPTRWEIWTDGAGNGLRIDLVDPPTRKRGRELRVGGRRLKAGVWVHLAASRSGSTTSWFVDGKAVDSLGELPSSHRAPMQLGRSVHGAIGRLALWKGAWDRTAIRTRRFAVPDATSEGLIVAFNLEEHGAGVVQPTEGPAGGGLPPLGIDISHDDKDVVVWTAARMPRSLAHTGEAKRLEAVASAHKRTLVSAAQEEADQRKTVARARSAARTAAARVRAESLAAVAQVESVVSVRNRTIQCRRLPFHRSPPAREQVSVDCSVLLDSAFDPASRCVFVAGRAKDGRGYIGVWDTQTRGPVQEIRRAGGEFPVHAISAVTAGSKLAHLVWMDATGQVRTATAMTDAADLSSGPRELGGPVLEGRPRSWDLSPPEIASNGSIGAVWSNGWEIWRSHHPAPEGDLVEEVIVPHADSPHPVAVTVSGEFVYWVDHQDEVVRRQNLSGGRPVDLWPAPKSGRGLFIDPTVERLFWVARRRISTESVIVDEPGVFVWLEDRTGKAAAHHSHVEALADLHPVGATWAEAMAPLPPPVPFDTATKGALVAKVNTSGGVAMDITWPGSHGTTGRRADQFKVTVATPGRTEFFSMGQSGGYEDGWYGPGGQFRGQNGLHGNVRLEFHWDRPVIHANVPRSKVPVFDFRPASEAPLTGEVTVTVELATIQELRIHTKDDGGAIQENVVWFDAEHHDGPLTLPPMPDRREGLTAPLGRTGAHALDFSEPDHHLDLGPMLVDASRGLTFEAYVRWKGDVGGANGSVVVFSDLDGHRALSLNVQMDRRVQGVMVCGDERVEAFGPTEISRWSWVHLVLRIDAAGKLQVFIDGVPGEASAMALELGNHLYPVTRLGGINGDADPALGFGAHAHPALDAASLGPFTGWIGLFRAHAEALSDVTIQELAESPFDRDDLRTPHDRSLVTAEGVTNWLHVGRIDGKGSASPLIELDLDAGLALDTRGMEGQADLLKAQADRAATARKAALDKAAAEAERDKKIAAKNAQLDDAHAKAAASIEEKQGEAKRQREEAQRNKAAAVDQASTDRSKAQQDARDRRAQANTDSDRIHQGGNQRKEAKLSPLRRDLADKNSQKAGKQTELANKRKELDDAKAG